MVLRFYIVTSDWIINASVCVYICAYIFLGAFHFMTCSNIVGSKYCKESGRQNVCRKKEIKGKKARNKLFIMN